MAIFLIEQTKRHSLIASLLGIPHLAICINKMDLVDWDEKVYEKIRNDYKEFASKLSIKDVRFIPISALKGDNIVHKSKNMDWYQGAPLLHELETLHISSDINKVDARFPVQTVLRPQNETHRDYRGYAGRLASGTLRIDDEVTVLPSGFTSKIKTIDTFDASLKEAFAPMSVSITLEDDVDVSRGDMIVRSNNRPEVTQDVEVMLCWLHNAPSKPRTKYTIKHTSNDQKAMIKEVVYAIDIETLERVSGNVTLEMNAIAKVKIRTTKPLLADAYRENRTTGSIILVDDATNETVAAGMIV